MNCYSKMTKKSGEVKRMGIMQLIPELTLPEEYLTFRDVKKVGYQSGIYFIYNSEKEIVYIGQAKNLKERLRAHFKGNTHTKNISDDFLYFKYYLLDNEFEKEIYETFYINKLNPIHNKGKKFTNNNKIKEIEKSEPETEDEWDDYYKNIKGKKTLEKAKTEHPKEFKRHILKMMNNAFLMPNE